LVTDKDKILNTAQKYVLKGQSDKAIREYQKLIKASSKDTRSHLKLGDLYLKIGENEKAIGAYLKVAELYVEEDLISRAISIYKKVLSLDPEHIEALQRIAKLYLKEGLRGDARNYYQTILKIRPNDQEALDALKSMEDHVTKEAPKKVPSPELAHAKHRHSPEKRSSEEVVHPPSAPPIVSPGASHATEISSVDKDIDKDAEMHYHLGIAYKEMDLYDYAISEFELASANASIKFDCYIMLGGCFVEKGDLDKSIEYYKTASELKGQSNEKRARLHFNLGCAYEANGMASEALNAFNLALDLDHTLSEAREKIQKLR
jgi:tetratricopeptide (TPR) repeat protein